MTEIQQAFRWLTGTTVILFVVVAVLAVGGYSKLHDEIQKGEKARQALCYQRSDVDERIKETSTLLRMHPHAAFIFAIPRSLIISGLRRDINTRHNLSVLDC